MIESKQEAEQATPPSNGGGLSDEVRIKAWVNKAMTDNIAALAIEGDNGIPLGEPGNKIYRRLLKIAGVVKGHGENHITPDAALMMVLGALSKYPPKDVEYQWGNALNKANPSFLKEIHNRPRITAADKAAKKVQDFKTDFRYAKTEDYIKGLEWLGYQFKLNTMNDRIFVNGQPIDDITADMILNGMLDLNFTSAPRIKLAITAAAAANTYHPIKDYLKALDWDGKDWIGWLFDHYVKIDPAHEKWGRIFFTKWMVGAIAKPMMPGKAQNMMLVLDGKQGLGKSTFIRWLSPLPDLYVEGALRVDSKDTFFRAADNWVWEVAELQSTTSRNDIEALKGFLTTQEIKERRAYGRYDVQKPVMASFVGTINENGAGFLNDSTGNRRYMVMKLISIALNELPTIDKSKIWAQAYHLYNAGYQWWLNEDETKAQQIIQKAYEVGSPIEEAIWELITVTDAGDNDTLTSYQILKALKESNVRGTERSLYIEIKKAMYSAGVKTSKPRVNGGRVMAYSGVKFKNPALMELNL